MILPKFIRFKKFIINIMNIEDIYYVSNPGYSDDKKTRVSYQNRNHLNISGNVVDELWQLIGLAMKSNNNMVDEQIVEQNNKQPEVEVTSEDDVA